MNILLVEDDVTLAMGIEYSLKNEGFNVKTVGKIKDAKEKISNSHIDIILLDVNLPDGNGYELCKEVRLDSEVPIIFLTACDEEVNIVMGLDLGADDYIAKPVRVRELVARINAVARRKGVLSKDKEDNKIIVKDNSGNVLTRKTLLEKLWDIEGDFIEESTLTVYIKRLREKLKEDKINPYIETVRGIGYKWIGEK